MSILFRNSPLFLFFLAMVSALSGCKVDPVTTTPLSFTDSSASYHFDADVGAVQSETFTLKNSGTVDVTGVGVSVAGPFTLANNLCSSVPAAGTCTFSVTYSPVTQGQTDSGSLAVRYTPSSGAPVSLQKSLTGSSYHYFVFSANRGDSTVSGFTIDFTTGILKSTGAAKSTATGPFQLGLDPLGQFIFVTAADTNLVSVFRVDSVAGTLTQVAGSPFATGTAPVGVSMEPTGNFLYVANFGSNDVSAFSLNRNSGFLTPISGSPFVASTGDNPLDLSMDPMGKFLYLSSRSGQEFAFTIDPTAGSLALVAGTPFQTGSSWNWGSAIDGSGKFLFTGCSTAGEVSAMGIDTSGNLSQISGSPFATGGTGAFGIGITTSGNFVYVANGATNTISAFSQSEGSLTKIQDIAAGASQFYLTVDSSDHFVIVTNRTTNNISVYGIGDSGLLTHLSDAATGSMPISVKVLRVPTP